MQFMQLMGTLIEKFRQSADWLTAFATPLSGCAGLPPKGETTHYDLCVASAPSSTAVTDSLDFQVADAPLQIQFA